MIAGLTVDSGLGSLAAWLAVGGWLVGSAVVISDGWRQVQADRKNGIAALRRCHERRSWNG